jgi:hypothetical protein
LNRDETFGVVYCNIAYTFALNSNNDKAQASYDKSIELYPQYSLAYSLKGNNLANVDQKDKV